MTATKKGAADLAQAIKSMKALKRQHGKANRLVTLLQQHLEQERTEKRALEVRLDEARRRTVPMAGGDGSVNFLPLGVRSVEVRRPHERHYGANGQAIDVYGEVEATILCWGRVVQGPSEAAQ